MKNFPTLLKLSSIFFSSLIFSTVHAVATVESRGEPWVEESQPASASPSYGARLPSNAPAHSGSVRQNDDRLLQTLNQVESLKQEVSELRGLVEVQDHEIKQLKKSQQDFYVDLEKKIAQISTKGNRNADAASAQQTINKTKGIQIIPKGKENAKVQQNTVAKSNNNVEIEVSPDAVQVPAAMNTTMQVSKVPEIKRKDKDYTATDAVDAKTVSTEASNTKASQTVKITPKPTTVTTPGSQPGTFKMHQGDSEKEAFDAAYNMVSSKQYDMAISAFQDFLSQYPRGEFAPNANYWLGEVHMVKWQSDKSSTTTLDEAARYFSSVTKDFPGTAKVSDSLLKLGIIAVEKGDVGNARRYFTDVKMQYPGSPAARVAEVKLQQLE